MNSMPDAFQRNGVISEIFHLEQMPDYVREDLLQEIGGIILEVVGERVVAQIPEGKREEFFRLFERPASDEEKKVFFATYVSNFKDLLFEEVARFKKEAAEFAKRQPGRDAKPS